MIAFNVFYVETAFSGSYLLIVSEYILDTGILIVQIPDQFNIGGQLFLGKVFGVIYAADIFYTNGAPVIADGMQQHPAGCAADRVYFSLGDKEKMTRNQRMAVVEEHMAKAADLLAQEGADTIFEQNPGGHFQEPVERLTKGIRWILQD